MNLNSVNLVNDDSLSYIKTLPDNCIDLIATDPPYFQVKSCSWDNQWENVTSYLSWLDEILAEMMEHIIRSSSREGDLVADFFMGSGATLKSALKLNRRVLGVELEKERFEQTTLEIERFRLRK